MLKAAAALSAGQKCYRYRIGPAHLRLQPRTAPSSMVFNYGSGTRGVATAIDLLKRKSFRQNTLMISESTKMRDAAARIANMSDANALMVTREQDGRVVGLLTVGDILKALRSSASSAQALEQPARDYMTPSATIVYAAPDDNLMSLSMLMTERRVSHLPIVDKGEILGVVSINDIVRMTLEQVRGGKANAVQSVLPRRGLGADTRVAQRSPLLAHAHHQGKEHKLYMRTSVVSLPRQQRSPSPIEDAFFVAHVRWPKIADGLEDGDSSASPMSGAAATGGPNGAGGADSNPDTSVDGSASGNVISYVGIADGVGAWRGVGVDPRLYAQRLMQHSSEAVWKAALARQPPPSPVAVMTSAWEATNSERVVGSCTAVIMMLDSVQNQVTVHGVGDCGVILLRDTDIERVGTLLRGGTQVGIRPGWRVSARATQQLKGFNQPFQLGWAPNQETRLEAPWQGETLVLPVQAGDVIIAASDGLFDNLDETDILELVEKWANAKDPPSPPPDNPAVTPRPTAQLLDGESASAGQLASLLAHRAAELSVDRSRDGPFARLAKENDILWTKGGRPDDVTVAVARVGVKPATDVLDVAKYRAQREAWTRAHAPLSGTSALAAAANDPTITGNVSSAVATPECGEDATVRILPRLLALQREAQAVELAERRAVREMSTPAGKSDGPAAAAAAASGSTANGGGAEAAVKTRSSASASAGASGSRRKKDIVAWAKG